MMENSLDKEQPHGQVNPGQTDPEGNEVVIKKNEGISDQGNEWADEEGNHAGGAKILGEKAENYTNENANSQDLPDEATEKTSGKQKN